MAGRLASGGLGHTRPPGTLVARSERWPSYTHWYWSVGGSSGSAKICSEMLLSSATARLLGAMFSRWMHWCLAPSDSHLEAAALLRRLEVRSEQSSCSVHSFWRLHHPQNGSRLLRHSPQKPSWPQSAILSRRSLVGVRTSSSTLLGCILVPASTGSPSAATKLSTTVASPSASSTLMTVPAWVPTMATVLSPTLVAVTAVARVPGPSSRPSCCRIGTGPEILSAASQKLKMLPAAPAVGHLPSSTGPEM